MNTHEGYINQAPNIEGRRAWYIGEGKIGRGSRAIDFLEGGERNKLCFNSKAEARAWEKSIHAATINSYPGVQFRPSYRWDHPVIDHYRTLCRDHPNIVLSFGDIQKGTDDPPPQYDIDSFWRFVQLDRLAHDGVDVRDPVMKANSFTNPDRKDDRVSRLMLLRQYEHRHEPPHIRVYNLMWHRVLSTVSGIDSFGWVRSKDEAAISLRRFWDGHDPAGRRRPGAAPLPPCAPFLSGGGNTTRVGNRPWSLNRTLEAAEAWSPNALYEECRTTSSIHEVYLWLTHQEWPMLMPSGGGGGDNFTAFQMALDMSWLCPWLDENSVGSFRARMNPKPGRSWRGSGGALIYMYDRDPVNFVGGKPAYHAQARLMLRELALDVRASLPEQLTLAVIEHSLCEFSKYMRMYDGITPGRAKYERSSDPLPTVVPIEELWLG